MMAVETHMAQCGKERYKPIQGKGQDDSWVRFCSQVVNGNGIMKKINRIERVFS
jgi:hypothetical protein